VIDETVRLHPRTKDLPRRASRHITDRAGLTWGVVQYHFGDLDGLCWMAVVDKGFRANWLDAPGTRLPSQSVPRGAGVRARH